MVVRESGQREIGKHEELHEEPGRNKWEKFRAQKTNLN